MKKKNITLLSCKEEKRIPFIVALANKILTDIGFVQQIDSTVKWDKKQWDVSPGNLAKAVILATFFDVRVPLSRISGRFAKVDTELLFGEGVFAEKLNDDAIGAALDRIAEANIERFFTALCVTTYSVYKIAFQKLHSDTTSISFYGEYDLEQHLAQKSDLSLSDQELQLTKGYNKDNRLGCKQAVLGKIVNEHGIPVASSVMDGNTSDAEWNEKALGLVGDIFEKQLQHCIYIADSKLINKPLFKTMMDPKKRIQFISRCPANFNKKLAEKITQKAYDEGSWQDIGAISEREGATEYKVQELSAEVYGHNVRLLVYQTSEGLKRFEKKKEKQLHELEKDISVATKKQFACEADAQIELKRFQKAHKKSIFTYSASIVTKNIKKRPPGNPGKNPKPPRIITTWHLKIQVTGVCETNMTKVKRKEESFVLITNTDSHNLNPAQVLENYKNQSKVEVQFRLLKDPCIAATIFLKTPHRIRSLVMILGVSLLIRALVQYQARKGYKECTKPLPKIGWNGAKLKGNITSFFIIVAFKNHDFVRKGPGEYTYSFESDFKKRQITTLLDLMDLTVNDLIN